MADMALGRETVRAVARFRLGGEVARSGPVTVAALRAFPARTVRAEFACSCGDLRRYVFAGPLLYDVVMAAAPAFDPARAKDRVRYLLSVTGADGHQATLSWGEIDPDYGDAGVLLATEIDDRPLDAEGPQLAVPRDKGGSRYVSQVTEIWIGPPR
ncbi:MAG TPA: hypothetical protein VGL93_26050 [Streptosporangiaceae bacterium]|jgi:DMSO/TMAO reductase YedYZ molybdopterin-dependent catalytic subunit